MNDEPNQATNPDESLAQAMPDPAGPPKPVEKEDDVLRALAVVGVVLVAGGGLLLPLTASTGATSGATRSAKIQWSSARPRSAERWPRTMPRCRRMPIKTAAKRGPAIVAESSPWYRRWMRWGLRQIEHCLALIGLGTVVYFSCFDLSRVTSGSMKPTLRGEGLKSGDLVLTERVSGWFRQPRRWEVIAFRRDDGVQVMKRVVGLPGEKIQMRREGRIVINGEEIAVPESLAFLKYFPFGNLVENKSVDCGDGYYVLGR